MTNNQKLEQVFCSVLQLSDRRSTLDARYAETKTWDSVAHMQLIAAIETAFDVMLDTDAVIGLSSFHEAVKILKGLGLEIDENTAA